MYNDHLVKAIIFQTKTVSGHDACPWDNNSLTKSLSFLNLKYQGLFSSWDKVFHFTEEARRLRVIQYSEFCWMIKLYLLELPWQQYFFLKKKKKQIYFQIKRYIDIASWVFNIRIRYGKCFQKIKLSKMFTNPWLPHIKKCGCLFSFV